MKLNFGYFFTVLLLVAGTVNAQQGPPPGPPPSPEVRLKQVSTRLEKELALKPDQKQKVTEAYKTFFDGMEKLRGGQPMPPPPPPPGKKEEVDKLIIARDESVKKILSGDQFKKYQEIEKTMRPGGNRPPGGPQDGPPPPPAGKQ